MAENTEYKQHQWHKYCMLFDDEIWPHVPYDDLWIFDKLILSKKLGHVCGPTGVPVPQADTYVVRPCVNLEGMGRGASLIYIEQDTWHLPAGYFWQQVFVGRHLSADFENGTQVRCSEGFRNHSVLTRFDRWCIVDDRPPVPTLVKDIVDRYSQVNVEMINHKVIEIHLRGNPDFNDGAVEIIPVWCDQAVCTPDGYTYVADTSGDRVGFYKKYH